MKQVAYVSGDTPEQFESAFNETCANLSRFEIIEIKPLSETGVFIYYETNEEQTPEPQPVGPAPEFIVEFEHDQKDTRTIRIDLKVSKKKDRYCCECENYDWGRGCHYRDGHVNVMDGACEMFNVMIEGRF